MSKIFWIAFVKNLYFEVFNLKVTKILDKIIQIKICIVDKMLINMFALRISIFLNRISNVKYKGDNVAKNNQE